MKNSLSDDLLYINTYALSKFFRGSMLSKEKGKKQLFDNTTAHIRVHSF